jgi:pantothenate kinase
MTITDIQVLYSRARDLARRGRRSVLGIVGPPGGGKSTLAQTVVAELGDAAALVPMDGFHLAQSELVRLGRRNRMGAPDTFDAGGYATLLRRLRNRDETVVYAPEFDATSKNRSPYQRSIPLVITEGNYLLLETGDWAAVRPLLDETWYVEMDENTRVRWLVQRHIDYGKSPQAARSWVLRSDQANAKLIAATRNRADIIVQRATTPPIGQ